MEKRTAQDNKDLLYDNGYLSKGCLLTLNSELKIGLKIIAYIYQYSRSLIGWSMNISKQGKKGGERKYAYSMTFKQIFALTLTSYLHLNLWSLFWWVIARSTQGKREYIQGKELGFR